jgi:hypothetical protein
MPRFGAVTLYLFTYAPAAAAAAAAGLCCGAAHQQPWRVGMLNALAYLHFGVATSFFAAAAAAAGCAGPCCGAAHQQPWRVGSSIRHDRAGDQAAAGSWQAGETIACFALCRARISELSRMVCVLKVVCVMLCMK